MFEADEDEEEVREKLTLEAVHNELEGMVQDPNSGKEFVATYKDPTDSEIRQLRELEEEANAGDNDAELKLSNLLIGDLLLEPDLDPEEVGLAWKRELFAGFMRAVGAQEQHIQEAQEFVAGESGNQ